MLAEFATRLACGLAATLCLAPWRVVPVKFFRTHCQVILGLLVLAALDRSRLGGSTFELYATIAAAVAAFLASACWGLGLPSLGLPLSAAIAATTAWLLFLPATTISPRWLVDTSSRLASAALLGSSLTAMLLGHHYLTAPSMSIAPLRRFVRLMGVTLLLRALLAGYAGYLVTSLLSTPRPANFEMFLGIRWLMGVAGVGLATWMTWQTVKIRSTQSATGILYIAMTLALFGELSGLALGRSLGVNL